MEVDIIGQIGIWSWFGGGFLICLLKILVCFPSLPFSDLSTLYDTVELAYLL